MGSVQNGTKWYIRSVNRVSPLGFTSNAINSTNKWGQAARFHIHDLELEQTNLRTKQIPS
jgi:hypothetical protein